MFQRRLEQTHVQTLSIGKRYELLFQLNKYSIINRHKSFPKHKRWK